MLLRTLPTVVEVETEVLELEFVTDRLEELGIPRKEEPTVRFTVLAILTPDRVDVLRQVRGVIMGGGEEEIAVNSPVKVASAIPDAI